VIDGDTIEIQDRIRLWGIDAPESDRLCRGDESELYRCGQKAAAALAGLFYMIPWPVICTPTNQEQYGRTVAVCTIGSPGLTLAYGSSRMDMRWTGRATLRAGTPTLSAAPKRPAGASGLAAS
jgi:endonuclease YncB( thermonuclease family)